MDLLAWPTAKAQLYLLEAAHVRAAVGRDRIRRNKDAYRELQTLQEILSDLHAGHLGQVPEKRHAAEVAAARWLSLRQFAAAQGQAPEKLIEVPRNVRRYLLALPLEEGRGLVCSLKEAFADPSTRAPSTAGALENDTESVATDLRSEAEGLLMPRPLARGGGSRLTAEGLARLAADLREQLDQEFTSLLSSIEEVQALMEAEVAGVGQLPSVADLQAFTAQVDRLLAEAVAAEGPGKSSPSSSSSSSCKLAEEPSSTELEVMVMECPASNGVDAPEEPKELAAENEVLSWVLPGPSRPRWADLVSDPEDELEEEEDLQGSGRRRHPGPSVARCGRCRRELPRSSFSRRGWRQARGLLPAEGREGSSATCTECCKTEPRKGQPSSVKRSR